MNEKMNAYSAISAVDSECFVLKCVSSDLCHLKLYSAELVTRYYFYSLQEMQE